MDLKIQLKTFELASKLIKGDTDKINKFEYTPQKVKFDNCEYQQGMPRCIPEETGIKSSYIENFYKEMSSDRKIDPHAIMIFKDGKIIAEAGFHPYDTEIWHISHSMCKSITALAVGIAIDEGHFSLKDRLGDIFKTRTNIFTLSKMKNITVENLLTMSACVSFNEVGAILENNWIKSYLTSSLSAEPGTKFMYNSTNTYMLGAIIKEKTGEGLLEFIQTRLLDKMGIKNWFWEKCPMDQEKAGWGLSLLIEDAVKIGYLCLNNGKWNGEQLVSKKWIKAMTSKHIDTLPDESEYGYGYQVWMCKREGSYQFNGMLGQNIVIIPDRNMIVAVNAGSTEFFPNSNCMKCIEKYFLCDTNFIDENIKVNIPEYRKLVYVLNNLKFHKSYESISTGRMYQGGWKKKTCDKNKKHTGEMGSFLKSIDQKIYMIKNNAAGVVPLFIQCLHNNYSTGIQEIKFENKNTYFNFICYDTETVFNIPVGIGKYVYSDLTMRDECYRIASMAELSKDEDDNDVLKMNIVFVETTNARTIKVIFSDDNITLKFNELPELLNIMDGAASLIDIPMKDSMINTITDTDIIKYRLEKILCPVVSGTVLSYNV